MNVASAQAWRALPGLVRLGLLLCGLALLLHVAHYAFLCDDAFISFRYARNLASGDGLVFNPGLERVEGYSNFLWTLLLAAGAFFGIAPEHAANPLSIVATCALAFLLIDFCIRERPASSSPLWLVVPALALASNRSFAVWATSGLETRLFELLVIAGLLSTIAEMRTASAGRNRPWSALWLALATLTRPDGLLIAGSVIATRMALELAQGRFALRASARLVATCALPVAAHYIFRFGYYGDWLPNTYYAKVGGEPWWDMGLLYLAAFAFEYALVLWLPLLVAGALALVRAGRAEVPALFAACIVPHAIYVAGIGGDHFEYRPVDLYLPLLFAMAFFGACGLARTRLGAAGSVVACALCIALTFCLPLVRGAGAPSGFETRGSPLATPSGVLAWPGVRAPFEVYCGWMDALDVRLIGVRQEEHAAFLVTVLEQGAWLAAGIESGELPADARFAISSVGAIPYSSDLATLDRLGLTDRVVARQPITGPRGLLAHEKYATIEYAREWGVELWGVHPVYPILPAGHPTLMLLALQARSARQRGVSDAVGTATTSRHVGENRIAALSDGRFLAVRPLVGPAALEARFPALEFESPDVRLAALLESDDADFTPIPRTAQLGRPYDLLYVRHADAYRVRGENDIARRLYRRALATNPDNLRARRALAALE